MITIILDDESYRIRRKRPLPGDREREREARERRERGERDARERRERDERERRELKIGRASSERRMRL